MIQSPAGSPHIKPMSNDMILCIAAKNHDEKALKLALKEPKAPLNLLKPIALYNAEAQLPLQYAFNTLEQIEKIESNFEEELSYHISHSQAIIAHSFINVLTDKTIEIFKANCIHEALHPMLLEAADHLLTINHASFNPTQDSIRDIIKLLHLSGTVTTKEEEEEEETERLSEKRQILRFTQSVPSLPASNQSNEDDANAVRRYPSNTM